MNLKYRTGYIMWRLYPYNDRCYHSREKFYTILTHSIWLAEKKFQVSILIHFWLSSNDLLFRNETVRDGQLVLFLCLDHKVCPPVWDIDCNKEGPDKLWRFWWSRLLLVDCAMLILYKNAQFDHIKSPLSLRLSELIYYYHIKYIIKYTKWYNINLTKLRKLKTNPIFFDE